MEELINLTAKDESAGISVQYIVTRSDDPNISDDNLNKVYSLLVIGTLTADESESLFVYDISRSKDRAFEIARVMQTYMVTPCSVYDILDDIL